jgi:hypothetical protein
VKHLRSYLHEYTASYEGLEANQQFDDANAHVVIRGFGEWAMSLNSGAVVVDRTAAMPVNAMTESIAGGYILGPYEVE